MSFNKQLRRKLQKSGRRRAGALPYLSAALICEKLLKEQDGVATPVRVVDTLILNPGTNLDEIKKHEVATFSPNLKLYVNLRPGEVKNDKSFEIYQISPSGKRHRFGVGELKFSERKPADGVETVVPVQLKLDPDIFGTYWYEILVDGVEITRVPLTIKLAEQTTVNSTPRVPENHARHITSEVDLCPHKQTTNQTQEVEARKEGQR